MTVMPFTRENIVNTQSQRQCLRAKMMMPRLVCVLGCMDVWLCRCMSVCMCGCVGAWVCVCVVVYVHGCVYVWLCRCMGVCVCVVV